MTYYFADPPQLRGQKEKYEYISRELQKACAGVENTTKKLGAIGSSYPALKSALRNCTTNISTLKTQTNSLNMQLELITEKYEEIEKKLVDNFSTQSHTETDKLDSESIANTTTQNPEKNTEANYDPKSIAWKRGYLPGAAKIGGIGVAGVLAGEVLGASYDIKSGAKATWKQNEKGEWEYDELGIEYAIVGEAHVAKGSAKGNIGYLFGNVNAKVGEVSAKGGIGAGLYQDGKFSPQLYAELSGKVVGLKGDAEIGCGTEHNNVHVKGEGEVGVAEAGVSGQIGKITYTDDKGKKKQAYGVKGEAGAEAYVATGSIEGGFSICGIDIDIGISGKAGGAGGKVGGYATTGGVSGSISGGLGVGLGLEIAIDWSDFHLGW